MSLIDWLIAFFLFVAIGFVAICVLAVVFVVRWWVARINADDLAFTARHHPRVRTRIQQPPIETEIADHLAREFPSRNPAQLI